MSKTVAISEDNHAAIFKKKADMLEKYGVSIRISDLVDLSIKLGIDDAAEQLIPNGYKRLRLIEKDDIIP